MKTVYINTKLANGNLVTASVSKDKGWFYTHIETPNSDVTGEDLERIEAEGQAVLLSRSFVACKRAA